MTTVVRMTPEEAVTKALNMDIRGVVRMKFAERLAGKDEFGDHTQQEILNAVSQMIEAKRISGDFGKVDLRR